MNRELKFRQPVFDSKGNFVSFHYWGYLDGDNTFTAPRHGESYQFIGALDKYGKEIYDNDYVKEYRVGLGCGSIEKYIEIGKQVRRTALVTWSDEKLTFMVEDTEIGTLNGWDNLEIVGNKWQNPELLQETLK